MRNVKEKKKIMLQIYFFIFLCENNFHFRFNIFVEKHLEI